MTAPLNHPLVLEPIRDTCREAPYGVRVIDDLDSGEEDRFAWYPTLEEAIADAKYAYPRATLLTPAWLENELWDNTTMGPTEEEISGWSK